MKGLVLVTGGDGFLGTNIVRALLERDYKVRIFTEVGREPVTVAALAVEVIHGDIRRGSDVADAAIGCDYIIHTAASTSIWPPHSKLLKEINIDGTRNVIGAALQERAKRLIHIGSANSFGFGTAESPGDESRAYACARYGLGYMDTKLEAQALVLDAAENSDLPAIVIAPTFMLGPYDTKPGSGRMVLSIAHRDVPGYTVGGRCYIYVKDVATCVVNALEAGRIGECYIVGNENLSYQEMFRLIARVTGVAPPRFRVPAPVSRVIGAFGSLFGTLAGFEPKISLPMARISTDYHYYTAAKAIGELSLPQTPIVTAVEEAYRWFLENGYV